MPFPKTLRDRPQPHQRTHSKDLLIDLRLKMANLLADRQPRPYSRRAPHEQPDTVVISDDSDPPTPPMQRSRHPDPYRRRLPTPALAPDLLAADLLDDTSDSDSDSDRSLPLRQGDRGAHRHHKRPKLYHPARQPNPQPDPTLPQLPTENERFKTPLRTEPPNNPAPIPFVLVNDTAHRSVPSFHDATLPATNIFDNPEPPPYYYETKFDVEMYRGPGFERFPVVLGTVEGHREICDRWNSKGPNVITSMRDLENVPTHETSEDETRCIARVLEVFPDIDVDFVQQKVRQAQTQPDLEYLDMNHQVLATNIISQVADMEEHPKAKAARAPLTNKSPPVDESGVTVPYNKNLLRNGPYLKEAVRLLAAELTHVPAHFIYKTVNEKRSLFDAYGYLQEIENDYYTLSKRPYNRSRQPRASLEKKYSRAAHEVRNEEDYAQMVNELQAAKQQSTRLDLKKTLKKEKEEAEKLNLALHKATGALIECQCCFDDEIPMNRTIGCEAEGDIHFFCFDCVVRLADTQVGMMKYEMLCMDGSGCKAALSQEGVSQAVPIKTFDKLALNQQQAEIAAAGIEGLEQCPYCDFKAICEPIEQDCVFNCLNPDCGRASCRRCKDPSHVPKSCEEAKTDRGLSARHLVEEARTESVIRKCPKCGVKIIKELGCNKMICTSCRCILCYVCKTDISNGKDGGYEHFNKANSKCKLHDQQGIDRHEVEADEAEKEAIKKAKAEDADLDEKQLQIETGTGQKKRTEPQLPAVRAHLHDLQQNAMRNYQFQELQQHQERQLAQQLEQQINGLEQHVNGMGQRVHPMHGITQELAQRQRHDPGLHAEVLQAAERPGALPAGRPALLMQQAQQLLQAPAPNQRAAPGAPNANNVAAAAANHALARNHPYLPYPAYPGPQQQMMGYPNNFPQPGHVNYNHPQAPAPNIDQQFPNIFPQTDDFVIPDFDAGDFFDDEFLDIDFDAFLGEVRQPRPNQHQPRH